jgi:hypothetical protein
MIKNNNNNTNKKYLKKIKKATMKTKTLNENEN